MEIIISTGHGYWVRTGESTQQHGTLSAFAIGRGGANHPWYLADAFHCQLLPKFVAWKLRKKGSQEISKMSNVNRLRDRLEQAFGYERLSVISCDGESEKDRTLRSLLTAEGLGGAQANRRLFIVARSRMLNAFRSSFPISRFPSSAIMGVRTTQYDLHRKMSSWMVHPQ
jgi:hypothetical protein